MISQIVNPEPHDTTVPNTAPVLEYRCLFTRDVQRKQKRWQDGRLRFHTFNRRLMVYDESSNFVGDAHWQKDGIEEGEELHLERNGILVQVVEYYGKKDQDLNGLISQRIKDREQRAAARISNGLQAMTSSGKPNGILYHQPKERNIMLTPNDHHGKTGMRTILPRKFSQYPTKVADKPWDHDRQAKRCKLTFLPPKDISCHQNSKVEKSTLFPATSGAITMPSGSIAEDQSKKNYPLDVVDLTEESSISPSPHENGDHKYQQDISTQSKSLEQKAYLSRKSKNTYASQLTGVTLSLNTSKNSAQKNQKGSKSLKLASLNQSCQNNNTNIAEKKITVQTICENSLSSALIPGNILSDKRSLIDNSYFLSNSATNTSSMHAELQVERQVTNQNGLLSKKVTPLLKKDKIIISVEHNSENDEKSYSPAKQSFPDELTSTLRIKPRPPRKMMFMESPAKYPSYSKNSIIEKRPINNSVDKIKGLESITIDLESNQNQPTLSPRCSSMCKKKENKVSNIVPNFLKSSNDINALILETSVDRQNIDFRPKSLNSNVNNSNDPQSKKPTNCFKSHAEEGISEKMSKKLATVKEKELLTNIDSDIEQKFPFNSVDKAHTSRPSFKLNLHSENTDEVAKYPINEIRTVRASPLITSKIEGIEPASKHEEISVNSCSPTTPSTYEKVCEKSRQTSIDLCNKAGSKPESGQETVSPNGDEICLELENSSSISVASCRPSVDAISSYNSGGKTKNKSSLSTSTSKVLTRPRVILSNPATKGLSLQVITANTIDALQLVTDTLPISRFGSQVEESISVDDDIVNFSIGISESDDAVSGPWSRESFDLFGNWIRPQNQIGVKTL